MRKSMMAVLLSFSLLINTVPVGAARTLTIEQARQMAIENSSGVQDVIIDRIKKQIELKQAKEGIRDIRKKENTIRFSLLFNIEWPEKHGMPKEIDLIMKVPQIENEIAIYEKQEPYEKLKSQAAAESAFYDVLQEEHNQKYLQERLQESKLLLTDIETKFKIGKGKKEDVDYVKNQCKGFEGDYQKSILNIDAKKKRLGTCIGTDVRTGYTFAEYFPQVDISRPQLEQIITFAKENDFGVYQKTQERKLAERDTAEILSIYKSQYSRYIGDIENYIRSREGKKMDYEAFIKMYNHTLTQIDSPWDGSYVINLLFFKIYIPKEWFKGEYSGTRYMEDQKYALFVSLTERDKARKAEQDAITALEDTIYSAYSNLKQMDSAYQNTLEALEMAEKSYQDLKVQNQLGLVEFSSLESARDNYYTQQNSLFEMKVEYAKALSAFNLSTGGYVNRLLEGGSFTSKSLESGDTFADAATWYIKNNLTEYTFQFGVNIPDSYGVDSFQLYYDSIAVGEKTSIEDSLIHMPITYADTTLVEVRFFKNNMLKYIAAFDGGQYEGELEMKKASMAEDIPADSSKNNEDRLGSWKISQKDNLRSEFSVFSDKFSYTDYQIYYQSDLIGAAQKDNHIVTLSLYFSNVNSMTVRFYNQGVLVGEGRLGEGYESGDILPLPKGGVQQ